MSFFFVERDEALRRNWDRIQKFRMGGVMDEIDEFRKKWGLPSDTVHYDKPIRELVEKSGNEPPMAIGEMRAIVQQLVDEHNTAEAIRRLMRRIGQLERAVDLLEARLLELEGR